LLNLRQGLAFSADVALMKNSNVSLSHVNLSQWCRKCWPLDDEENKFFIIMKPGLDNKSELKISFAAAVTAAHPIKKFLPFSLFSKRKSLQEIKPEEVVIWMQILLIVLLKKHIPIPDDSFMKKNNPPTCILPCFLFLWILDIS
jgi:hypothetical protein